MKELKTHQLIRDKKKNRFLVFMRFKNKNIIEEEHYRINSPKLGKTHNNALQLPFLSAP
jgi:hypothetical protein